VNKAAIVERVARDKGFEALWRFENGEVNDGQTVEAILEAAHYFELLEAATAVFSLLKHGIDPVFTLEQLGKVLQKVGASEHIAELEQMIKQLKDFLDEHTTFNAKQLVKAGVLDE